MKCISCNIKGLPIKLNEQELLFCSDCGLLWQKSKLLADTYYESNDVNLSDEKIRSRIANCRDRIKTLRKYIDLNNTCDIGCGEGTFISELIGFGYKEVFGIEPNDKGASFARSKSMPVYKGDIIDLGRLLAEHDLKINNISLFHVIEHLTDPIGSLTAISEALPSGGYLVIETPNIGAYSIRRRNYRHKLVYPEHLFYYSPQSLANILIKTGYRMIAQGKRDFDMWHLPVSEGLFRLGFSRNSASVGVSSQNLTSRKPSPMSFSFPRKFFSQLASRVISSAVIALGRLDYIWVVAKKNL